MRKWDVRTASCRSSILLDSSRCSVRGRVHEDDPRRAVLAALAIHRRIGELTAGSPAVNATP